MKMESMSKNVVNVMIALAKNPTLAKLLYHNVANPMKETFVPSWKDLIKPNGEFAKIFPFPFDPDGSTATEGSFIRVYYNDGEFSPEEVIAESQLHIDIIVSKNLWLINDGASSLIRPYDIMGRVVDLIGRRSLNSTVKLHFRSYQHLSVNTEFDCIRLYAEYMSIET